MAPPPKQPSYLIIGAGVFGVSTAYHLITQHPDASVTLVDRDAFDAPSRVAASWDWNKVVRADYDDLAYCRLALEAQDVFRSDPLWRPFFHQTGVYWICRSAYARDVIDNYRRLGRKADLEAVPIAQARRLYGGLFDAADYSGAREVLVNRSSGWAAAGDCLVAVTRRAIELGVRYVTADVATLRLDGEGGRCSGVQTGGGEVLTADRVVLCTGAFTAKLLEISAASSGIDGLRAGPRIVAGAIATGMARLPDRDFGRFADMPVGMQGYTAGMGSKSHHIPPHTQIHYHVPCPMYMYKADQDQITGPFLGSLPPTPDREIKWWGRTIFRNTHPVLPGRSISAPPEAPDYAQWAVPPRLQEDVGQARRSFYGTRGDAWPMVKHRICWDAFTTSGDFIVSAHPAAAGLYVATCGSFHGFKFFPVIGRYVAQMLAGDLEPELAGRWAWDRERPDPALNPEWPRAEMRDMLDPVVEARL